MSDTSTEIHRLEGMFDDCDNVEEVIGQAIGAGSMCWESVDQAGVFDSTRASEVSRDAVTRVRELIIGARIVTPEVSR